VDDIKLFVILALKISVHSWNGWEGKQA